MAKYMQDSNDIQINDVSGTDNINFSFKNGNSIDTKIGDLTDLKTTNKSNIVGAINSIVESGSNANGNWIKYADGTMICTQTLNLNDVNVNSTWGNLYVYTEVDNTWHNFPQEFTRVDGFSIEISNMARTNGFWLGDYGRRKVESSRWKGLCLLRPTSDVVSAEIKVIAIGRWK